MRSIEVVVMRRPHIINPDAGPNTVAIVKAEVLDNWCNKNRLRDPQNLFSCIMEAVTDWAQAYAEGLNAIRDSSFDFNIGDLEGEMPLQFDVHKDDSRFLEYHLLKHGITNLAVETFQDKVEHVWEFDDKLFDDNVIDEDYVIETARRDEKRCAD